MFIILRNRLLKILLLISCVTVLALHLAQPINLTATDIGRHIKNGELILGGQWDVLYKNFYSYTWPNYPFINHHWFFGVISFGLFHMGGFAGLVYFYILLLIGAYLLSVDSARRYSNFYLAFLTSVLALLMTSSRAEIRPEGFSMFFVALDFWLLQRFVQGTISQNVLDAGVLVSQVIWVNTHIFFFLGPLLVLVFLWQAGLAKDTKAFAALKPLLMGSVVLNLINPSGFWGMLTPLNGFKKFGYDLAENQSAFFMMHRFPDNMLYKYFLVMALLLAVGMVLYIWKERLKALPFVFLGIFVILAGMRAVRLIMPFGFLFIPLMGYFYAPFMARKGMKLAAGCAGVLGLLGILIYSPVTPYIGLSPSVNASAEFYKQYGLRGPIFSNYDIGGYLIYHFSPQEKVFVDNRQEAFPVDFFRKIYIPMQEDNMLWNEMSQKYGFNVVYFYRHDLTPWGQQFMIDRVQDPQWAPVFVDDYVIMFARRGSINQAVIDRFELPKSMFGVVRQQ